MTRLLHIILFILTNILFSLSVNAQTELLKILNSGNSDKAQVFVTLDNIPEFSMTHKAKRIDITLDTYLTLSESFEFKADDRIVKFLTQSGGGKTVLTFFLRYEPQKVNLTAPDDNNLVLEILLGNQFTKAYPDLSSKLQGVTIVEQKSKDYANPFITNPYRNNWRFFFSNYEPEIRTTASLKFSIPPFPVINLLTDKIENNELPEEFFIYAKEEQWEDLIPIVLNKINIETNADIKKKLVLTFGEVLLRSGNFKNAYKQLYLLQKKYVDEPIGIVSSYLLALLRAIHEDPYIADYDYRVLEKYVDENLAISPYIYISQIETALATNQLTRARKLLTKDNIALPDETISIKELRQTDYWFASGELIKAYVGYSLIAEDPLLNTHPYSLNGYCTTLYHQKKYEQSSTCFGALSSLIEDKSQLSLISLKKAMAEQHFKTNREMYVAYSTLEDTYPGTVTGFRAALKKTDIRFLSQPSWQKTSVKYYNALFEKATDRDVAEEAALKEAIVYAELKNNSKSINLLIDFLRNFRKGKLKSTALALLIEILPKEIEKLIKEEKYVETLVLAKKNRSLFQKNWLDVELLALLAEAYHKLSIYDEAKILFLYLLSTTDSRFTEKYYYPLIKILYSQGNYETVEDYATQYNFNFHQGKDKDQIFLVRLKALIAAKKEQMALDLISRPLPDIFEIQQIAADLYFKNSNHIGTINILLPYWKNNTLEQIDSKFLLAESLYQEQRFDEAEILFNAIKTEKSFFDQAHFRLASMEKDKGKEEEALKIFKEIVEKGNDPLWKKLAQRELDFHELAQKY